MSPFSFLILLIGILSLCSLVSLAKGLPILLFFFFFRKLTLWVGVVCYIVLKSRGGLWIKSFSSTSLLSV